LVPESLIVEVLGFFAGVFFFLTRLALAGCRGRVVARAGLCVVAGFAWGAGAGVAVLGAVVGTFRASVTIDEG
jgi:hypothetical protein